TYEDCGFNATAMTHCGWVALAAGVDRTLVAWLARSTFKVRYAIFDGSISSMLYGPFDLSLPEDVFVAHAVHAGSNFYIATESESLNSVRVRAIDDFGKVVANTTFASAYGDVRLSALHGGVSITASRGTSAALSFGWAPPSLAPHFVFQDLTTTGASGDI